MATNTRLTGTHVDSLGASTRATRAHMANLSFQVQDIGVQLASGQNPFMILAQQGSQIVGIFQQAGDAAGQLAYKVGFAIGRFLPWAAVIGTAYGALKLFQDTLNDRLPPISSSSRSA
jgi:phage-related minor tail protein